MTSPFAKALTKHIYQMGAPASYILPPYGVAILLLLVTGWLWELVPCALVWHLFLKIKFEKDEYWVSYFLESMREKTSLEP